MKLRLKCFLIFAACLMFPAAAFSQTTLVTGTVTDPNGIPYAGGTVKAQLTSPGATVTNSSQAQCTSAGAGAAPCQLPIQGTVGPALLDPTGSFSVTLYSNTSISPGGTQWIFTVSISPGVLLPLGTGQQSFQVPITITGATQSVSATLSAAAPKLTNSVSSPTSSVSTSAGTGVNVTCSDSAAVADPVTSVAIVGGNAVYAGTFGATNLAGSWMIVSGFSNSGNNGVFPVLSSTSTTFTVASQFQVPESAAASATPTCFINMFNTGQGGTQIVDFGTSVNGSTSSPNGVLLSSGEVFNLTSVDNAIGGNTTYHGGTFPASNLAGVSVTIKNFTNPNDNGTFTIVSNTTTTLTVNNALGAAQTHPAEADIGGCGANLQITNDGGIFMTVPSDCTNSSGIAITSNDVLGGLFLTSISTTLITNSGGGGLTLLSNGSGLGGANTIRNTDTGGTLIQDSGGGGLFIQSNGSLTGAALTIRNTDTGGTFITDSGGGSAGGQGITIHNTNTTPGPTVGILIESDQPSAPIELRTTHAGGDILMTTTGVAAGWTVNSNALASITSGFGIDLINNGGLGTNITDNVADGITLTTTALTGNIALDATQGIIRLNPTNATAVIDFGSFSAKSYLTATNCAANGSAANPSIAACGSAAAGMFSCATAASTGTCQVNTTAVTANSEITITQDAADGGAGQLNTTCETTNSLPSTAPILLSKNPGTSFTLTMGTITTNPACFEYTIKN